MNAEADYFKILQIFSWNPLSIKNASKLSEAAIKDDFDRITEPKTKLEQVAEKHLIWKSLI